jgi:hypothetical protein
VSDLPALPQPYPHLRVGHWSAAPLPEDMGLPVDLTKVGIDRALADGLDCVVVSAAGSDQRIDADLLEVLLACEAAGVPTVLRAGAVKDLRSPVAAVVSHFALETDELYEEGLKQVGPERAFELRPVVDPVGVLTAIPDDVDTVTAEVARVRRRVLAEQTARAQADRFVAFLGLPVEPEPLVTALIVSRHAKNLHYTLQNLKRQNYARIDPLLVVDPLYEKDAREETADWDLPLRIVTANVRSTPADKLNVGLHHAYGDVLAVIEETGLYGSDYLRDQVQALQASRAHLVGKASWFVWNDQLGKATVHAASKQRSFEHTPALGTLVLHRSTARSLGFARRVSPVEGALTHRIREAGGKVYNSHAYETLLLRRGQMLSDIWDGAWREAAFSA